MGSWKQCFWYQVYVNPRHKCRKPTWLSLCLVTADSNHSSGVCDGLALHRADIWWMTPSQSLKAARLNLFFLGVFYALAVGFAKIAVLALYWRMFSLGRLRYPIIVLTICSVIWTLLRVRIVYPNNYSSPKRVFSNITLRLDYTGNCTLHTSLQVLGPISGWQMSHQRCEVVPRRSLQSPYSGRFDHCSSTI